MADAILRIMELEDERDALTIKLDAALGRVSELESSLEVMGKAVAKIGEGAEVMSARVDELVESEEKAWQKVTALNAQLETVVRLKRKVAELEGERGQLMTDVNVQSVRLTELQAQLDRATSDAARREEHTERCEDELDWWRKTHCDDRPPADIWEGATRDRKPAAPRPVEPTAAEMVEKLESLISDARDGSRWNDVDTFTQELAGYRKLLPGLKCPVDLAWRGECGQPAVTSSRFCKVHEGVECSQSGCHRQMTRTCEWDGQFVCNMPICDECQSVHQKSHDDRDRMRGV